MSAQKRSIDLGRKFDVAVIQRIAQLDYFGCGDGEKFDALTGIAARAGGVRHPVKYVEQVIRQVAPSGCGTENALQQIGRSEPVGFDGDAAFADDLFLTGSNRIGIVFHDIRMGQKSRDISMIECCVAVFICPSVALQFDKPFDERIGQRRPQGVSHRYVDLFCLVRQSVEQRHQQIFIGQYDGGAFVQRRFLGKST